MPFLLFCVRARPTSIWWKAKRDQKSTNVLRFIACFDFLLGLSHGSSAWMRIGLNDLRIRASFSATLATTHSLEKAESIFGNGRENTGKDSEKSKVGFLMNISNHLQGTLLTSTRFQLIVVRKIDKRKIIWSIRKLRNYKFHLRQISIRFRCSGEIRPTQQKNFRWKFLDWDLETSWIACGEFSFGQLGVNRYTCFWWFFVRVTWMTFGGLDFRSDSIRWNRWTLKKESQRYSTTCMMNSRD